MAIGETEKAFMDSMIAHHEDAIKLAENYLKKSDTANRPPSVTRMATSVISEQTYQIENMQRIIKEMSGSGRSADKAAAVIMGDRY